MICQNRQAENICLPIFVLYKIKKATRLGCFYGAGNQNRTDDLVITNDVLYRLSHTSILRLCYYTKSKRICQAFFEKYFCFFCFSFFFALFEDDREIFRVRKTRMFRFLLTPFVECDKINTNNKM